MTWTASSPRSPATGDVAQIGTIAVSGGSRSFTPPFSGDAVLLLSRPDAAQVPTLGPLGGGLFAVLVIAAGLVALRRTPTR